jgi:2-keto-4-pentenoate hydratase/2-oxohepta-3-ene-1,7-dioic acid hydratase in catechol pathway
VIVGKALIPDPNKLALSCIVNGRTLQSSSTEDMIFDVPTIISFLSQGTTLLPGTVILTGSHAYTFSQRQVLPKVLALPEIPLYSCLLEILLPWRWKELASYKILW